MFNLRVLVVAALAAFGASSDCNNFNNNCKSCIQYAGEEGGVPVHTCTYCPVDGICHAVGSLFNKCDNDECISLCTTSTCKMDTIQDCDAVASPYGVNATH